MEDNLLTHAGRDYVSPFPPTSKLPLVQPAPVSAKPVIDIPDTDSKPSPVIVTPLPTQPNRPKSNEPLSPPVFNRSGQTQGFRIPPYDHIDIPPGRWTTTDKAKKNLPRSFVMEHLRGNPDFNIQEPHARFFGSDEKYLTVAACTDNLTGWGRCNINIIKELALLRGEPLHDEPEQEAIRFGDVPKPAACSDLLLFPTTYWNTEDVNDITKRLMRRPYHPTKWGLALTIPTELHYIPVKNLILMTMWEGGKIPDGWGQLLRQYVKHLIVPSETQKQVFAKEYAGEISVVPLGVDTDAFTYETRPPRGENDPFTILLCGSPLTSRKSPMETIGDVCYLAFGDALGEPIDDWKIILKTRQNIVGAGAFKMNTEAWGDPHIEVKSGYYTDAQLNELYHQADIGIALSKYEGAGMIPAEMMATGLPVILSRNSGLTELCDPMFNVPIEMTGETTPTDIGYAEQSGLNWFVPDWRQAAQELRWQYELWKMTGKRQSEMGRRASEYIQRRRTWKTTARQINEIVNKVVGANGK